MIALLSGGALVLPFACSRWIDAHEQGRGAGEGAGLVRCDARQKHALDLLDGQFDSFERPLMMSEPDVGEGTMIKLTTQAVEAVEVVRMRYDGNRIRRVLGERTGASALPLALNARVAALIEQDVMHARSPANLPAGGSRYFFRNVEAAVR